MLVSKFTSIAAAVVEVAGGQVNQSGGPQLEPNAKLNKIKQTNENDNEIYLSLGSLFAPIELTLFVASFGWLEIYIYIYLPTSWQPTTSRRPLTYCASTI